MTEKWISVESVLPEINKEVIVFGIPYSPRLDMGGKKWKIMITSRLEDGIVKKFRHGVNSEWDKNGFEHMSLVTHWQPLLDAPKDITMTANEAFFKKLEEESKR